MFGIQHFAKFFSVIVNANNGCYVPKTVVYGESVGDECHIRVVFVGIGFAPKRAVVFSRQNEIHVLAVVMLLRTKLNGFN